MRATCYNCCIKHLMQAQVLLCEAAQGHPMHKYLAIGHLAEAADEVVQLDKKIAIEIRTRRKMIEENMEVTDLLDIVILIKETDNGAN